jgi:hypothetical protein
MPRVFFDTFPQSMIISGLLGMGANDAGQQRGGRCTHRRQQLSGMGHKRRTRLPHWLAPLDWRRIASVDDAKRASSHPKNRGALCLGSKFL